MVNGVENKRKLFEPNHNNTERINEKLISYYLPTKGFLIITQRQKLKNRLE